MSMYKYIKRILDIIFSFILLIVTLPITLIVLLITMINLGFPLIDIRLPREGKDKKPFYMYKIRTRVYDKDGKSTYTKVSKVIDQIGLNELPQLLNILKGEMSFIGPRAFICGEKLPEGKIDSKRYLVKPGIFSLSNAKLSSAKGGRYLPFSETLKCDIEYYDNFGFKQDVKIFYRSIGTIVRYIFTLAK